LAARVTDIHAVDEAVVVQVGRGGVFRETEVHILTIIRRGAGVVVLPELRAVREVDGEERFAVSVIAGRVVSAAEKRDELARRVVWVAGLRGRAHLHLANRGLRPRLTDLRIGEAPHPLRGGP